MGLLECPVCTLYLRADMSLEEHLGTHPTDKVIKALVSMATKAQTPAPTPTVASPVVANSVSSPMELAMMAVASGSRPRTPPNALMFHTSGYEPVDLKYNTKYEPIKQAAPPPPPPPPAPMVPNAIPTAITVVKASDMGYPINNVMIVKSCSTKYVQQIPQTSGNSSGLGMSTRTSTVYPSGTIEGRNVFIEHDRGGSGSLMPRRQIAPSFYPRYTNERYSGPPPPYSTAITSTISANSQLQQASMTGNAPKYEQKPTIQSQQPTFCSNPPTTSVVAHPTPTVAVQQQHIYHAPPTGIHQPSEQIELETSNFDDQNILQAQYTEKEDGNFLVTENPKKVVEYTENDEGDFMVIEKIVKSPPRVVQIDEEMQPSSIVIT